MRSTVLEYLCTELECFLQVWNAFYSVGKPLYRVGMLSIRLECFLEGRSAFKSVGMLSTEMEYLCTELGYLCTGLEYFRQS
jgi:hypothetical protein